MRQSVASPRSVQRAPRTRRRVWVLALVFASCTHALLVLLGSFQEDPIWAEPRAWGVVSQTIDVEFEFDQDTSSAGGGSELIGTEEVALGSSEQPVEEKAPVASVVTPKPSAIAASPEPPEVVAPSLDEPEFDAQRDWYEQDVLFANTSDMAFEGARPRAAFKRTAELAFPAAMPGRDKAQNGRFQGRGQGRYGGPGGPGGTGKAAFVDRDFAFGGTEGAFLGRMCFVPEDLRSLKELGACTTQLQFRTDSINVPPREFEQGFPGVSDRDEWFSILYTGTVMVQKEGLYAFRVLSDDGAVLHIDGKPVVDNDGLHGPISRIGRVTLSEGAHRLELWYFQGPRLLVALQVFVTPPGQGERLLGPTL